MATLKRYDGTQFEAVEMAELKYYDGTSWVAVSDDIPNRVLEWPHNEGSGTILGEVVGEYPAQDGSISGATWTADAAWWQGQYLDYDGADDVTTTGSWGDFGSTDLNGPITIILEASWPSGDDGYTIHSAGPGDQIFGVGLRSFITQDLQGQIGFFYRNDGDTSGDYCAFATDDTFDDGSRHFVAIQVDGLDPSTGQIYVDTGYVTTNVNQNNDKTGSDFGGSVRFGSADGAARSTVDLGRIAVSNTMLSEGQLDDLAEQHGFSP